MESILKLHNKPFQMEALKQESTLVKPSPKPFESRKSKKIHKASGSLVFFHLLCILAPFYFNWAAFWVFFALSILTGMAISISYHRNLAHKSFKLPKWLEYSLAYCAVHAFQGDPIDWVSTHRCHHQYTDTEQDPHSPIQGFWFSHIGWIFDSFTLTKKVCPNYFKNYQEIEKNIFMLDLKYGFPDNAKDLERQIFYKFIYKTYFLHIIALAALLYLVGGVPFVIWGMCVRIVVTLQATFMLNSVCHIWGNQPWQTGDLSKNNWLVALITFGEGWHNNHHAFEYSARVGLEWWHIDIGWYFIRFLQAIGLATNVKLPSKMHKQKLAALSL